MTQASVAPSVLPVVRASQPIGPQLSGHVICRDQSGASDAGSVGLTTGPRPPAPAERRRPECGHWHWTQRGAGAAEVNTLSAETRGHTVLHRRHSTMAMDTIKKVYILLWKNLIIKVRILFEVYTITHGSQI